MKQPRPKGGAVCWRWVWGTWRMKPVEVRTMMVSIWGQGAGTQWRIVRGRTSRVYVWGNARRAQMWRAVILKVVGDAWLARFAKECPVAKEVCKDAAEIPY